MVFDAEAEKIIDREVTRLSYSKEINDIIEKRVRENVTNWIAGRSDEAIIRTGRMDLALKVTISNSEKKIIQLDDRLKALKGEIRVKEARAKAIDLYKITPQDITSAMQVALTELKDLKALLPVLEEKTEALKQIGMLTKKIEKR